MKEFPHLRFHTHGLHFLHFWRGCVLVVYKYFVMHFEDQETFNLCRRWTCIPASTFCCWSLVGSGRVGFTLGISITYPAFLTSYSRSKDCKTTDTEMDCVFPFNYNGVTYTGCTIFGDSKPWCVTKTDRNGDMEGSFWGLCDATCPIEGCRIQRFCCWED